MTSLSERREQIDDVLLCYRTARERVKAEKKEYRLAVETHKHMTRAQEIFQEIARGVQENTHAQIARVVTSCLQAIWEDLYHFEILFEKKRGKTEANLVFVRSDGLVLDPLEESSGGVVDVAAFSLRLVSITMSQPQRRRLVVLDEPFKNVRGVIYQERVRGMVEQVCKELGFQIIINTDLDLLQTGTIIQLE